MSCTLRRLAILRYLAVLACLALLHGAGNPGLGQNQCRPPECTTNALCIDGLCIGEPAPDGAPCEEAFEFNECFTNPTCVGGSCKGDLVPDGTSCEGGCGVCLSGVCTGDASPGAACDDENPCTTDDRCQVLGPGSPSFCLGTFVACEEADQNPCTLEFCNPDTGQCETGAEVSPCSSCEACVATGTGAFDFRCDAYPAGTACDDDNECTGDGVCDERGFCSSGVPATPVTSRTVPPSLTATPGAEATPTGTPTPCAGDCQGDDQVTVDEILTMVTIALGTIDTVECTAGDVDGDGEVTVDEIITAVNVALNGCP